MNIDVRLPGLREPTPGIPAPGQWVHSAVRAEMSIDVISPLPNWFELYIGRKHLLQDRLRVDAFDQFRHMGPQGLHRGNAGQAQ